jgi:uncharacterized membrane protein
MAVFLFASGCDKAPPQPPAEPATSDSATSAAAATVAPPAPSPTEEQPLADLPPRLRALGTEPFWAVEVEADRATYTTPDDQKGQAFMVRRQATPQGAVLIGRLADANFVLAIARHDCSDGMSDRIYRWRAVLRRDGQSLQGCAETPDRLNAAPAS